MTKFEDKMDCIGKYILVGVDYIRASGELAHRTDWHGVIVGIEQSDAFPTVPALRIALRGSREGEFDVIPADFSNIWPAKPGPYTSRSTGETIRNPDFISEWTVHEPKK